MVGDPRSIAPAALALALTGLALVWGAMLWLGGSDTDKALLAALYAAGAQLGPSLVEAVTHIGAFLVLAGFALIGVIGLLARGEMRRAFLLTWLTITGPLLVELQKGWIGRLRPHDQEHLVVMQSYAFPSGHSANSLLIWLSIALLCMEGPRARKVAIAGALLVALLIGLSRPMLGVHWPSDVIGGWALGLFWLLLWARLLKVPLRLS